jgi:hypothetical protein
MTADSLADRGRVRLTIAFVDSAIKRSRSHRRQSALRPALRRTIATVAKDSVAVALGKYG